MTAAPALQAAIRRDYRHLYQAGLRAVRYSKPARYTLRDILRRAFRSGKAFEHQPERISNTLRFLQSAAEARGFEHRIVRNLLLVAYWRKAIATTPPYNPLNTNSPQRRVHAIRARIYENVETTVKMLNATSKLDLRM